MLPITLPERPNIKQIQTALPLELFNIYLVYYIYFKIFPKNLKFVGTKSTTAPLKTDIQTPGNTKNNIKHTTIAMGSKSQCKVKPHIADIIKRLIMVTLRPKGFIIRPNRA